MVDGAAGAAEEAGAVMFCVMCAGLFRLRRPMPSSRGRAMVPAAMRATVAHRVWLMAALPSPT